ncbi:hypothetical protein EFN61_02690, partial [Leuconostoc citreum]|nr:hypothetical protein [Leuconostoc citreum]
CETNENTQLAITTKGFSAVCSVRLILAIYHITTLKRYNLNVISFLFYKKRVSAPRRTYRGHSTQKIYGEALRITDEIGKNYVK